MGSLAGHALLRLVSGGRFGAPRLFACGGLPVRHQRQVVKPAVTVAPIAELQLHFM
jgi:hypothetical protein